jgi:hypothetical protein
MTKVNSINKVAAVFLAAQLFIPATVFAQVLPPRDTTGSPISVDPNTEVSGFCTRVDTFRAQVTARLVQHKAVLDARRSERTGSRTTVRATLKNKTDEIGVRDERSLSSLKTSLEAIAETTAHKAAVRKFQTSMSDAVTTRRAALKTAQMNFQESLDGGFAGRRAGENFVITTYTNAVTTALNKAKADCVGRIREDIIKERLRTSLGAARAQLTLDMGLLESQDAFVQESIETRRTATKKAFDEFKAKAEAARTELKAAFAAAGTIK